MTTRRSFLKTSAVLSAGLLVAPKLFAASYDKKYIGLQLYTVRDHMAKDPAATLAQVAKIGYTSVEGTYSGPGKYHNTDVKAFADLLKQNGLIMPSAHYRLGEEKVKGMQQPGTILSGWQQAVDDAASIGQKY